VYAALSRLLFALPPGTAHEVAMAGLAPVEHVAPLRAIVRSAFAFPRDARIAVRTMGLDFASPVGLAGGFDKNARRPRALAALGFGHVELGTVTAHAQEANPAPNLFRLREDRALVNRLGFPNEGAARVAARVARVRSRVGVPLGISIGKSRVVKADDLEAVVADYVEALEAVRDAADFIVVNVSSPNTAGLRAMQAGDAARTLLGALAPRTAGKPLLVKIAPDLDDAALEGVVAAAMDAQLAGVVATNTTTARVGLSTSTARIRAVGTGGLSGPPLRERAVDVVRRVRSMLGKQATVIGVGGVERAEHAMALVRAGADLVQMYTGFVYGGPGAPSRIARELAAMVEREGAKSLRELRG
jgi:dihydroorotate dehydrogenase